MRYCLGPHDAYGNLWAALAFMPFGLFFDFMDGKVARWRKKSSLMGQELDSLADLVLFPIATSTYLFDDSNTCTLGILWRLTRRRSLCHRSPHSRRPSLPHLFRPLWSDASGSFQHYRSQCSQGRNWEE